MSPKGYELRMHVVQRTDNESIVKAEAMQSDFLPGVQQAHVCAHTYTSFASLLNAFSFE